MQNIKIPVMLMQGEDDTLFNLHEAVATYAALRAEKTPVKMVWQSWGHSDATPVRGELGAGDSITNPDGSESAEGRLILEWFDHYLKGDAIAPALDFSFFRPWVSLQRYRRRGRICERPVVPDRDPTGDVPVRQRLAGLEPGAVTAGTAAFMTPPLGLPLSTTEISAVSQSVPLYDAPGTFAKFVSAPLSSTTDIVGIPLSICGSTPRSRRPPARSTRPAISPCSSSSRTSPRTGRRRSPIG